MFVKIEPQLEVPRVTLATRINTMADGSDQIDTVMKEKRLFAPPAEFASRARIKSLAEYQSLWDEAAADPEKFWADLAREELHWFKPFDQALIWNEPVAQWFAGGKTNVSYNCLDSHLAVGLGRGRRFCGKGSRAIRDD